VRDNDDQLVLAVLGVALNAVPDHVVLRETAARVQRQVVVQIGIEEGGDLAVERDACGRQLATVQHNLAELRRVGHNSERSAALDLARCKADVELQLLPLQRERVAHCGLGDGGDGGISGDGVEGRHGGRHWQRSCPGGGRAADGRRTGGGVGWERSSPMPCACLRGRGVATRLSWPVRLPVALRTDVTPATAARTSHQHTASTRT